MPPSGSTEALIHQVRTIANDYRLKKVGAGGAVAGWRGAARGQIGMGMKCAMKKKTVGSKKMNRGPWGRPYGTMDGLALEKLRR